MMGLSFGSWRRAVRRLIQPRQMVVLGTAHKVGSTWLRRLVADMGGYRGYSMPASVMEKQPGKLAVDIDLRNVLGAPRLPAGRTILKSHSLPPPGDLIAGLPEWVKLITMIRDPRDVVVSASFYLARLPVERGGWGDDFSALREEERLIRLIEKGSFLSTGLRTWYRCPTALNVHYEDLLSAGIVELRKVADHLGLRLEGRTLRDIYRKHSFKAQTGRDRGQEDKAAFLRKGVAGDWRQYFDASVKHAFKHSCDGEWNDLLVEMGYEEDHGW